MKPSNKFLSAVIAALLFATSANADGINNTVPAVGSITGLGTGIATALGVNVGTAGAPVVNGGALGTPSSGLGTNITGVNAATLGGATFAAPVAIGGGTPGSGAFTTLNASGVFTAQDNIAMSTGKVNKWSTDTGLSRCAAGNVCAGNGTAGDDSGTFDAGIIYARNSINIGYGASAMAQFNSGGALILNSSSALAPAPYFTLASVATTSAVCYNVGTGLLSYDGTIGTCTLSDGRLKNVEGPLLGALDKILQIHGVYYNWKDPATYGTGRQVGIIAQDVQKVYPELVSTDAAGKLSADYQKLVAPIIEALRELKADNDNLRACNDIWKCRLFGIK